MDSQIACLVGLAIVAGALGTSLRLDRIIEGFTNFLHQAGHEGEMANRQSKK